MLISDVDQLDISGFMPLLRGVYYCHLSTLCVTSME